MNAGKSVQDMEQCPSASSMEIDHAPERQKASLGHRPPDHAVDGEGEWLEDPENADLAASIQRLADLPFGAGRVGQAGIVDGRYRRIDTLDDGAQGGRLAGGWSSAQDFDLPCGCCFALEAVIGCGLGRREGGRGELRPPAADIRGGATGAIQAVGRQELPVEIDVDDQSVEGQRDGIVERIGGCRCLSCISFEHD
jgi:hypothetical protein